jgi:hypothetical protein
VGIKVIDDRGESNDVAEYFLEIVGLISMQLFFIFDHLLIQIFLSLGLKKKRKKKRE